MRGQPRRRSLELVGDNINRTRDAATTVTFSDDRVTADRLYDSAEQWRKSYPRRKIVGAMVASAIGGRSSSIQHDMERSYITVAIGGEPKKDRKGRVLSSTSGSRNITGIELSARRRNKDIRRVTAVGAAVTMALMAYNGLTSDDESGANANKPSTSNSAVEAGSGPEVVIESDAPKKKKKAPVVVATEAAADGDYTIEVNGIVCDGPEVTVKTSRTARFALNAWAAADNPGIDDLPSKTAQALWDANVAIHPDAEAVSNNPKPGTHFTVTSGCAGGPLS
jgi:hypothetical protein